MKHSHLTSLIVLIILSLSLGGCVPSNSQTTDNSSGSQPSLAFVVLIIDTSASVSRFGKDIAQYAQLALERYTAEGPVKVTIIDLNEAPSVEFQTDRELFPDDITGIVSKVGEIRYDAKGTDIISALDLVTKYWGYEPAPPSIVKVLCFTDGHIDNAPGKIFRRWEEADLSEFAKLNADIGIYFIDTDSKLREAMQKALQLLSKPIVRNWKEAQDELELGEPNLP